MADITRIHGAYKVALQDLGSLAEDLNETPTTQVRDEAIQEAVRRYTERIPRIRTSLLPAVTTGFYPIPSDFDPIMSRIVSIESPVDQSPPVYLEPEVTIHRRETGLFLFLEDNPTETFRLTHTALWNTAAPGIPDVSGISVAHEDVLGKWAAAITAMEFETRFSNSITSQLDSVNYRGKATEWREAGKSLLDHVMASIRPYEWAQIFATRKVKGSRLRERR